MSDWWSKKLSGEKPSIDRTTTPPVQVPLRFQTPSNFSSTNTPSNTTVPAEQNDGAAPSSLSEGLRTGATRGGEATRKETLRCPSCGSNYVFSRSGGGMLNGATPAPRCYECGWNGLYAQAQQGSWA